MAKTTNKELLAQLREMRDRISVFYLGCFPVPQSREDMKEMEQELKKKFHHWWDGWMKPLLDEVERKLTRNSYKRFQKRLEGCDGEKADRLGKKGKKTTH